MENHLPNDHNYLNECIPQSNGIDSDDLDETIEPLASHYEILATDSDQNEEDSDKDLSEIILVESNRNLWSRELANDIEMNEEKIAEVKNLMSKIQLPLNNAPDWLNCVDEKDWNQILSYTLKNL